MVNSRVKGSTYERDICRLFNQEFGFVFKRDLEQYRSADHGDIVCEDPVWPFVVELKRYASGPPLGQSAWWSQATKASEAAGKLPVLIYKYDRQDAIVCIQRRCIARSFGVQSRSIVRYWTELSAFILMAREVISYDLL